MIMESAPAFAKGRGFIRPPPVKKPGSKFPLRFDSVVDDLVSRIETMDINSEEVEKLKEIFTNVCENEELLRLAVDNLFTKARKDRMMCRKLGPVFGHYQNESAGSAKIRTVVLSRAQKDFGDRHDIRAESDFEAINCAVLLCQIFHHMRLTNKEPLIALAVPVCSYMEDLFNPHASEDSIVEGARQLILNGEDIAKCNTEKLEEMLRNVRVMLITKPLSIPARCHLLYALEYVISGWKTSPDMSVYRDNGLKITPSAVDSPCQVTHTVSTNSYSEQPTIRAAVVESNDDYSQQQATRATVVESNDDCSQQQATRATVVDSNNGYSQQHATRTTVVDSNNGYSQKHATRTTVVGNDDSGGSSHHSYPSSNASSEKAHHGSTCETQRNKYTMPYTDVRKILASRQEEEFIAQRQSSRSSSIDDWDGAQEQKYDSPPPMTNFADSQGQQRGRPIFKGRGFINDMPITRPGKPENDNRPVERSHKSVDEAWGGPSNHNHWFQHDVRGEEEDSEKESDRGSQWRGNRGDENRRGNDKAPQWRGNRGGDGRRGNESGSWRDNRGNYDRKGRSDFGSWRGNDDRKGSNRGSQRIENEAFSSPLPDDDQEVW